MKLYPPTPSGSKEMFSDYEKETAYDKMIDLEIDQIHEERIEKRNAEYCDELENEKFKYGEPNDPHNN